MKTANYFPRSSGRLNDDAQRAILRTIEPDEETADAPAALDNQFERAVPR